MTSLKSFINFDIDMYKSKVLKMHTSYH